MVIDNVTPEAGHPLVLSTLKALEEDGYLACVQQKEEQFEGRNRVVTTCVRTSRPVLPDIVLPDTSPRTITYMSTQGDSMGTCRSHERRTMTKKPGCNPHPLVAHACPPAPPASCTHPIPDCHQLCRCDAVILTFCTAAVYIVSVRCKKKRKRLSYVGRSRHVPRRLKQHMDGGLCSPECVCPQPCMRMSAHSMRVVALPTRPRPLSTGQALTKQTTIGDAKT